MFVLYREENQLYDVHIYPLPLESPSHPHPAHLGHQGAPSWPPCSMQQLPLASYFAHGSVCMLILISQFVFPPLPLPFVQISILYICIAIPAPEIGSPVPFF